MWKEVRPEPLAILPCPAAFRLAPRLERHIPATLLE